MPRKHNARANRLEAALAARLARQAYRANPSGPNLLAYEDAIGLYYLAYSAHRQQQANAARKARRGY